MKPLYMWAGGKNKMIPKYQASPGIPYTDYSYYVEPFFGGGAMMIHVAQQNKNIKRFVLNDINREIIGIYESIKSNVELFMLECDAYVNRYLPLDKVDRKKYYYEVRDSYIKDYSSWNNIKDSATLYFLMKTSFNGVFQTMKDSNGRFATPAGLLNQTDSVYDKGNVLLWNQFLQKVDIKSGDWKNCIDVDDKTFFFFDPPYRDSFTQYGQIFDDDSHKELIDFCIDVDKSGHIVFYCNRETPDTFYSDNKKHLQIEYYDIVYTAGRRATKSDGKKEAKKAKEVLLFSPRIAKIGLYNG
jgi:DNA adenine methylase